MNSQSPALKTLQVSPNGQHIVGKNRKTLTPVVKRQGKITDFCSKAEIAKKDVKHVAVSATISSETRSVGTDIDATCFNFTENSRENIVRMMINSEPTSSYWKNLAEERRIALQEALRENLQCYQELASLKEENRRLKKLADEGRQLKELVEQALSENKANDDSGSESN